jgi:hypothetical protein
MLKKVLPLWLMLITNIASAGVILGDQVTFEFENCCRNTVLANAGIDGSIGNFKFDFNAGLNDDMFEFTIGRAVPTGFGSNSKFIINDLDFVGSDILLDFSIASTSLTNLSYQILSPSSMSFNWDPVSMTDNTPTVISGSYITSQVPEPSIIALFGLGLFGLSSARRRRTHN